MYIQVEQRSPGNSNRQAQHADGAVDLVPPKISNRNFDVVF